MGSWKGGALFKDHRFHLLPNVYPAGPQEIWDDTNDDEWPERFLGLSKSVEKK